MANDREDALPTEPKAWAGYVSEITDDLVVLRRDDWGGVDACTVPLDWMQERYSDALTEGRMFIVINGEFYWRLTRWTADEIAEIDREAKALYERFRDKREAYERGK